MMTKVMLPTKTNFVWLVQNKNNVAMEVLIYSVLLKEASSCCFEQIKSDKIIRELVFPFSRDFSSIYFFASKPPCYRPTFYMILSYMNSQFFCNVIFYNTVFPFLLCHLLMLLRIHIMFSLIMLVMIALIFIQLIYSSITPNQILDFGHAHHVNDGHRHSSRTTKTT